MTSPAQSVQREVVSPLELFFDLVFVFAVSQLSHHLPGRVLRSEHVEFDANHMLERCRLFLIIALGNRS
jgi:low temperature requirement protein LtrA